MLAIRFLLLSVSIGDDISGFTGYLKKQYNIKLLSKIGMIDKEEK
jgi:hypothetical protein